MKKKSPLLAAATIATGDGKNGVKSMVVQFRSTPKFIPTNIGAKRQGGILVFTKITWKVQGRQVKYSVWVVLQNIIFREDHLPLEELTVNHASLKVSSIP